MERRKYSTRFYCPRCKHEGKMKMLWLDESINLLRCEDHLDFMKQCNCRTKDLIIMDFYAGNDIEETQKEIEDLPLTTEEEAKRVTEDRLEEDYARELKEAWKDEGEDIIGFDD